MNIKAIVHEEDGGDIGQRSPPFPVAPPKAKRWRNRSPNCVGARLLGEDGMKSMTRYVAILDGVEGAYGIVVPDLPGCTAAGETIADVVADAVGAVREWILDAREDGETIPKTRDMAALKANGRLAEALREGAAFIVIPVLIDSGRPARANLSLDSGLLEAIDDAAKASGLTRSSFIAKAVREKIEHTAA